MDEKVFRDILCGKDFIVASEDLHYHISDKKKKKNLIYEMI